LRKPIAAVSASLCYLAKKIGARSMALAVYANSRKQFRKFFH